MGPTHRHALESLLRLIRELNVSARSSSSLLVRTRRTRIACPTLPLSSSLRSRLTSRSWKRLRREPSLLLSSKHQTSERAVKIRRKSVRSRKKTNTNFYPRVKIQKWPQDDSRVPYASSSFVPVDPLPVWMSSLVSYVYLCSFLDFYIFTDNTP